MNKIEKALIGIGDGISVYDTVKTDDGSVHLYIRCKEKPRTCRDCGSHACRILDSGKDRKIHHTPIYRKPCLLMVNQRRYICSNCGATFMEHLDWIYPHLNITRALFLQIHEDLKHYTSKKEIARVNGITPYFVSAVEKKIRFGVAPYLPKVLCLDDVHVSVWNLNKRTGQKYMLRFVVL